jgi:hypothetical protein
VDVRDLERRLTAWSPDELTALLERRGDVLLGRPPGSLAELARRLARALAPGVTEAVIQPLGLDSPAHELWSDRTVAEIDRAVSALGGRVDERVFAPARVLFVEPVA